MRILDIEYKKVDLQSIVRDNCKHLSTNQQKKALQLLKKYQSLFDGTLGDWKTKPVSFQIKEGVSAYQKRGGETVQTGGIRKAACIWMGFAIFHYT